MKLWVWGKKKQTIISVTRRAKMKIKLPLNVTTGTFMISEVSHSLVPDVMVSPEPMDLDQIRCKYDWW